MGSCRCRRSSCLSRSASWEARATRWPAQSAGHAARMQARGIDHDVRRKLDRAAVNVDGEQQQRADAATARESRHDGERSSGLLQVAAQCQHQRMAIDDAGRRRPQSGGGPDGGLERSHLRGGEPFEIVDAIGQRVFLQRCELAALLVVDRDDDFAATSMSNALLRAVLIEQAACPQRRAAPSTILARSRVLHE